MCSMCVCVYACMCSACMCSACGVCACGVCACVCVCVPCRFSAQYDSDVYMRANDMLSDMVCDMLWQAG
jgi:hypothetical protein